MPDNRIYDAINLFKYSPTGHGTGNIRGDAAYQRKYQLLAVNVQNKLWRLWSANEIGYVNLPIDVIGDSKTGRRGFDICVSKSIEPPADSARYQTPESQGKLAATSCTLVHEAVHLVTPIASYAEQETLCRMLEVFYFRDLLHPHSYQSRVTGTHCTALFLSTTPLYDDYRYLKNRVLSQDLIDSVLDLGEYRTDLESNPTAGFIVRSLPWWGGLTNRWPSTRGYYLRSLASQQDHDYAEPILQILESLSLQDWEKARTCCGNIEYIRRGLAANYHLYSIEFTRRITRIQQKLGENFGIRPASH